MQRTNIELIIIKF